MNFPAATMLFAVLAGSVPAAAATAPCSGDCDGDAKVTVDEIVSLVAIALGERELSTCTAGDRDNSGSVEVDELIAAIDRALVGCEDVEPLPYKTRIAHPFEPYLAFPAIFGGPAWVKFTIRVGEPGTVYFQNSAETPFHHDFVTATLSPYIGWTAAEIDAVSLHAEGQELVFGAVLYSPTEPYEIAIQLVRRDAYSVDDVVTYFSAVRAAIDVDGSVPFFYFPSFEQQPSAYAHRDELEAEGIRLGSTSRWLTGDACYASGWAYGRLVYIAGDEIDDAYESGALRPQDVLLTDGVPAEIPFVAGVVSLAPSTPSSHVAILAADWGIPFVHVSTEASAAMAEALVGRDVVLRATTGARAVFSSDGYDPEACQIRMVDVTESLTPDVAEYLRSLKQAPDLSIQPVVRAGTYAAEVGTATPADIVTIGGKAANYGFLLRAAPDNTRAAIAFTFDLWNDYLDQDIDGIPLRQRIATLLAPFSTYPPTDFEALFDALDDARDLIDDVADFTPAQKSAIVAALDRFAPDERIRFRSSTNVEDSDVFTGAGLYESESGCLADDIDDDDEGPSRCDATRDSERGVFRALRKVFQSFYNDNAYLERLRHRVDESQVGMAVLVHPTFVDETELANGVATLRVSRPTSATATIVSQPGAFSVTNPEDDGRPEVVDVYLFSSGVYPNLRQGADRLPLGATALTMPDEYTELSGLLRAVGDAFGTYHGETRFDIEFEYKKIAGEGLVVKQVRRIPPLVSDSKSPPVLIHAPAELCTFQGEYADVFANHRLKVRWNADVISGPVSEASVLHASGNHRYVDGERIAELEGAPADWPEAEHGSFDPLLDDVVGIYDSWSVGEGGSQRTISLQTYVPRSVGPLSLPIVFPEDLGYVLVADYAQAVSYIEYDGTVQQRSEEIVRFEVCRDAREVTAAHLLQERSAASSGVAIDLGFYWPPYPLGAVAGYTAPLDRWAETGVDGPGDERFSLSGYFSRTYKPEHHNFAETFVLDPYLDEELDASVVARWRERGVRALIARFGFVRAEVRAWTLDGRIVDVGEVIPEVP